MAVMHDDNLSYAETLDAAISGLTAPDERELVSNGRMAPSLRQPDLAQTANEAFERYLQLQGQRRFAEAAEQLKRLEEALGGLMAASPGRQTP